MQPTVAVIVAPGDPRPPGLDDLDALAALRLVDDAPSLRAALDDGAEALGVWDFRTTLVHDLWPHVSSVRWIHAASAGVDSVPVDAATAAGITVTNARGLFDRGIAEFVLLAVLAFAKDLPRSLDLQRQRVWQHRDSESIEDRHLLVVGAGSIGRSVARLARAAGLRVSGIARTARPDDPDFDEVAAADQLHRLLGAADDVAITAPLTAQTAGLFDDAAFAAMRPGARLVNVGRGEIVDEAALLRALEAGRLGGAALDVFATEPLPAGSPLWQRADVIVSPHQAGDVAGWEEALGAAFVANLRCHLAGEPLHNVVAAPAAASDRESVAP